MRHIGIIRTAAVTTAAAITALTLSSCSITSGNDEHDWPDAKQMSAAPAGDSVPSLVAADATTIKLAMPAYGKGETYLSWDSDAGVTRDDCSTGALGAGPSADRPAWWPGSTPEDGQRCGWWRIFEDHGRYYAWQVLPKS